MISSIVIFCTRLPGVEWSYGERFIVEANPTCDRFPYLLTLESDRNQWLRASEDMFYVVETAIDREIASIQSKMHTLEYFNSDHLQQRYRELIEAREIMA